MTRFAIALGLLAAASTVYAADPKIKPTYIDPESAGKPSCFGRDDGFWRMRNICGVTELGLLRWGFWEDEVVG